ncbi:MAG: hypothetical protein HY898_18065 [Deltaproteobacteria bacterium]|nr:hypothetical protein [Deltaproteobacteria bacterium]
MFEGHAERARRGQWQIEDLPWDEPIRFCGTSKRDQILCKLDTVDLAGVMYHLQLGARMRMGDHLLRSWNHDRALLECLEWHDGDEHRHVRVLRRLIDALQSKGETPARNDRPLSPDRLWRVAYSSRERLSDDRVLLNMLIDEAVSRTLFGMVAGSSGIPLVRATFDACSQDDVRHVEYLTLMAARRFESLGSYELAFLHGAAVLHTARLQSALRPYIGSFAGASRQSAEAVVTAVFGAASRVLSDLGANWKQSPVMRLVHSADRSPWLLWLLR